MVWSTCRNISSSFSAKVIGWILNCYDCPHLWDGPLLNYLNTSTISSLITRCWKMIRMSFSNQKLANYVERNMWAWECFGLFFGFIECMLSMWKSMGPNVLYFYLTRPRTREHYSRVQANPPKFQALIKETKSAMSFPSLNPTSAQKWVCPDWTWAGPAPMSILT